MVPAPTASIGPVASTASAGARPPTARSVDGVGRTGPPGRGPGAAPRRTRTSRSRRANRGPTTSTPLPGRGRAASRPPVAPLPPRPIAAGGPPGSGSVGAGSPRPPISTTISMPVASTRRWMTAPRRPGPSPSWSPSAAGRRRSRRPRSSPGCSGWPTRKRPDATGRRSSQHRGGAASRMSGITVPDPVHRGRGRQAPLGWSPRSPTRCGAPFDLSGADPRSGARGGAGLGLRHAAAGAARRGRRARLPGAGGRGRGRPDRHRGAGAGRAPGGPDVQPAGRRSRSTGPPGTPPWPRPSPSTGRTWWSAPGS